MGVLRVPVGLAKWSGMLPSYYKHYRFYKVLLVLNILNGLNFVIPEGIYLYENIDNFDESTEIVGSFLNMSMNLSKMALFLYQNDRLRELLEAVDKYASDKHRSNYALSQEVEKKVDRYSVVFTIVLYVAVFGVNCAPLLAKMIEVRQTGQLVRYKWELPFKASYVVVDLQSSPAYEIAYFFSALGIVQLANSISSIEVIFLGLCLHIYVLLEDLKNKILELNFFSGCIWDRGMEEKFLFRVKSRIQYHSEICDIVKMLESVYSGIFFAQFLCTFSVLCTQAFLATRNFKNGQALSNLTFYVAAATQMLLYTYFGGLVTTQSEKLVNTLTELSWDELKPNLRIYIRMMFLRSQKPCQITFMNMIDCTLNSFKSVLMTSFNVFALLRSVNDDK